MNIFLALFLLVNLVLAHLPSTPASLRRSAAHKRRLDDTHLSPAPIRRSLLDDLNPVVDLPTILPQPPSSSSPPPSSDTSTPTSTPSTPSPDPSSSDSLPSSTTSDPVPSTSPSPSPSDSTPSPSPSSSDPAPSDSTSSTSQGCNGLLGLGLLCDSSSSPTPSSTDASPSPSTSNPPQSSDPPLSSDPPQSSQPPSTTDTSSTSATGDLCALLGVGCSSSSTPVSSDPPPSLTSQPPSTTDTPPSTTDTPPTTTGDLCALLGVGCSSSSTPVSSDTASTPPASTDTVTTPPSSTTTGDLCALFGLGCPSSSTPVSSNPPPQTSPPPSTTDTPPPSTTGDSCALFGFGCPSSSTPISDSPSSQASSPPSTTDTPPSTTGDLCGLLGVDCPPSSTPVSSATIPTQSPSDVSIQSSLLSSSPVDTVQPLPSVTSDLCAQFGIGCSLSSTPVSSNPASTLLPSASSEPPGSTTPPSTVTPGSTQFHSSEPLSTPGISQSSDSSLSFPSFPSGSSIPPSSLIPDSASIPPSTSLPPLPSNSQFQWLTQSSLIYSSISDSVVDTTSLTDPDQVPTPTTFSTTGTPTVAPSVVSLPSGVPARIVPGSGGVDPGVDNLNGFTLIAVLFDQGLNWETVVQNTDSPGQIFAWLPQLIQTALSINSDQVKSFALQVWIPNSYQGPPDISQLGTTWLGYVPATLVDPLAAQIKTRSSPFYLALPSPYSDLASHVDPSFDIMTVTTTTGIPGSGGSSNGSTSGASNDSRTRENAIIGVVSALGGITLLVLGYLVYRAIQKRRELAHRRLSDPPNNPFTGEAPPNRNFDQDSIGGQRRRSFYFAEDSLRGFSDYNDGARRSPEHTSGLNRRPIAGNIGPPVMRENSLNF